MEKRQNYSRKREAILSAICSTDIHPTADWIYQKLKPIYPDLSLGTVYRNIARFKEDGLIISVGVVEGQERLMAPPLLTPTLYAPSAAAFWMWKMWSRTPSLISMLVSESAVRLILMI